MRVYGRLDPEEMVTGSPSAIGARNRVMLEHAPASAANDTLLRKCCHVACCVSSETAYWIRITNCRRKRPVGCKNR